jgi:hypothetical protein
MRKKMKRKILFLSIFWLACTPLMHGAERIALYTKAYNEFLTAQSTSNMTEELQQLNKLIELYAADEHNKSLLEDVQTSLKLSVPLNEFLEENFERLKSVVDMPQEINEKIKIYSALRNDAQKSIGRNNKMALEKIEAAEEIVTALAEKYNTLQDNAALRAFIFKQALFDRASIHALHAELDRLKGKLGEAITHEYVSKGIAAKVERRQQVNKLIQDLPKVKKQIEKLRQDNFDLAEALQAFQQEQLRAQYVALFSPAELKNLEHLTQQLAQERDAYIKEHPVQMKEPKKFIIPGKKKKK